MEVSRLTWLGLFNPRLRPRRSLQDLLLVLPPLVCRPPRADRTTPFSPPNLQLKWQLQKLTNKCLESLN
ncbi:C2H2 zinc finger protein [Musa troglodytarum]|uniref:C2H2 zinc finger protein n=1 Tax=Musa troglodytarum TaxID=320322 RepID=A0A9E7JHF9_9LILI|nr:C2H2 zinc finger protein [Musa troglodytarum]URD81001.1 C2H2 zinc finger protein [Musa troglodytarum]